VKTPVNSPAPPDPTTPWCSFEYADAVVNVQAPPAVAQAMAASVRPFFDVTDERAQSSVVELQLRTEAVQPTLALMMSQPPRIVKVDTSLYKHLASEGERWELEGAHLVRISLTGTSVLVDRGRRTITVYQPDAELLTRDATRLLKGLLTVALEVGGGVQVHASGVVAQGKGVLLMGDMWQGKTTLLLELLREFEVSQLSCDTVALLPDPHSATGVLACGWPSPFSVSHGTLADNPALYEFFPPERRGVAYDTLWSEGKKTVLTSDQVVERLGTSISPAVRSVDTCLIVRFRPDEPTGVRRVERPEEFEEHLRTVYLGSHDPIYHNWHGYIEVADSTIDHNIQQMARRLFACCDVHMMTWAPSAVSLLKRLASLGRVHKDLSRVLDGQ
jgi:hypothetical protein